MKKTLESIEKCFRNAESRKKILFTILVLTVFRIGSCIPVPFIDRSGISLLFDANQAGIFGLFDLFTGGSFSNYTLLALGVSPYITASIIIQLMTVFVPALEELSRGGKKERDKFKIIMYATAVVLAILQAIGYAFGLFKAVLSTDAVWAKILVVLILSACSMGLTYFADKAEKLGIGNGVSLIIFAGILSRVPRGIGESAQNFTKGPAVAVATALFVVYVVAAIFAIVYISESERRVPVHYARHVVGNKSYGGSTTSFPLKINQNSVLPVIFTVTLIQIPATAAYFAPESGYARFIYKFFSTNTSPGIWFYLVFSSALIVAFNFFYSKITIKTQEIANEMKNYGGFIPGIRPGKPTKDLLDKYIKKLNILGAIFLCIINAVPILFAYFGGVGSSLAGTSLIIIVGVAIDLMRSMDTENKMHFIKSVLK